MTPIKTLAVMALSLFSTSSYAELTANKTKPTKNDKIIISYEYEQEITGDLYLAAVKDGNIWTLDSGKSSWSQTFRNDQGFYHLHDGQPIEIQPTVIGTFSKGTIVEISANNLDTQGAYTIFQIITTSNGRPSDKNARIVTDSLTFEISPETNQNQIPNTDIAGQYFTPTLPSLTLGNYTDVKNSKAEWDQLKSDTKKQKQTLYWEKNQLLGLKNNKLVRFDDLRGNSFTPPSNVKLTISNPLSVTYITAYPGCIGKGSTNPRICGEFNPASLSGSEVFSQRWTRLNNLDVTNNPLYANIADKSKIIYDLSVQVSVEDVMTPAAKESMSNNRISLAFEVSMSKIPGDFSVNSCKPNRPTKFSSALTLRMTQKGLRTYDPTLVDACKVDSNELQHYYINVRAVNIDTTTNEINKSKCDTSTGCKVHLLAFLDAPGTEYEPTK